MPLGRAEFFRETPLDDFERDIRDRFGIKAALYLPLLRGDDCIGLLILIGSQANMFGETAIAPILRALDASGLNLKSVSVSRPSLDDVFLTLTGRTLREDAA